MLAVKSFETTIVIKFLSLKRGEHNELFKESAVNGLGGNEEKEEVIDYKKR